MPDHRDRGNSKKKRFKSQYVRPRGKKEERRIKWSTNRRLKKRRGVIGGIKGNNLENTKDCFRKKKERVDIREKFR